MLILNKVVTSTEQIQEFSLNVQRSLSVPSCAEVNEDVREGELGRCEGRSRASRLIAF